MSRIQEYLYNTAKGNGYYRMYERLFADLQGKPVTLLEIGVQNGGSLELWRDWFSNGTVVGLDKNPMPPPKSTERIRFYQGLQEDIHLLDTVARECAPQGFDIIIDDASHLADESRKTFWHLFKHHLKPGGFYVIEDWGTGYFHYWADGAAYEGKNHLAGMVGFVKELIDEVGSPDHTSPDKPFYSGKPSYIRSMQVQYGMVCIERSDAP